MPVGVAIDFEYFRYTAQDGTFFAVRCDKTWGANAQSGLGARNAADPVWVESARNRTRKCVLQDPVSSRKTTRILGTAGAAAGVAGTIVVTSARGASGNYSLTSQGQIGEKRPKQGAIVSKPEPVTT
jgi:hypothetical protein